MKRSSRYIGYSLVFICLLLLAGTAVFPQAQIQTFTLNGLVVVNREGVVTLNLDHTPERGAPDVEVRLTGGGIEQKTVTDQNGEFRFEAPVGTYELSFRHPAYYETTVKGVEIREKPSSTLKITLPLSIKLPQLILQRDPEIIGPKMVPAPELELSFKPRRRLAVGQPIQGALTIKNMGKGPILMPTEPYSRDEQYSPIAKIAQIYISAKGYNAHYDQKFICLPSENCKSLVPNETISFPITIYEREGYEKGRRVAQAYPKTGEYKLNASVHFKLPSDDPNNDVDTRTEVIEREFSVLICNSK